MSDPTALNECLAAAAGTNAFGEYELQGIDSRVAQRWLVNETGEVTRLTFDSNICGGGGDCDDECGPRISMTECGPAIPTADGSSEPFECPSTDSAVLCGPPS